MSVSDRQQSEPPRPELSLLSPRSVLIQVIANGSAAITATTCWQTLPQMHAVAEVQANAGIAAVLATITVWWKVTSTLDRKLQR